MAEPWSVEMSEFRLVTLQNHLEVLSGYAFASNCFNLDRGEPLLRIRDLGATACEVLYDGPFSEEYLVADGDILIGMDGDFLVWKWRSGRALLNQRVCKPYSTSDELFQGYLYWLLIPEVTEIHRKTPQTTVRHLSSGDIKSIKVKLPPANEQHLIANILDTLDTAIRRTEDLIAKLQNVKDGLLHDLLTRGIGPDGQLRPRPEDAPELYQDSPLGMIPREWVVQPLRLWIKSLYSGVSVRSEDRPIQGNEIGVLKTSAISARGFVDAENKVVLANQRSRVEEPLLDDSILVSRMNTPELVGLSCYVERGNSALFLPDRLWQLMRQDNCPVIFSWLSMSFRSPRYKRYVSVQSSGTSGTMKNLSQTAFLSFLVAKPGSAEQLSIFSKFRMLEDRLSIEQALYAKLCLQKAGLMDDLLTGRVRVTDLLPKESA